MRLIALAFVAALLLAGCADPKPADDSGSPPVQPIERQTPPHDPMPEGAGHSHADPAQHEFLWNYEQTSYDPLASNAANVAGIHALDLEAGHLFGAVYGSHGVSVDGGMWIWNLTDPAKPVKVGSLTIPGSVGGDRSIGATRDGDFVVLGMEPVTCFGHVNPAGAPFQAVLVDTRDKSLPIIVDAVTVTGGSLGDPLAQALDLGAHSIAVHRIADADYAFVFGKVYRIDRSETGATFVHVSSIPVGHDLYLRDTPDGGVWGLSANGFGDFALYNFSDPVNPVLLGEWQIPNRGDLDGQRYLHTADVSFLDGRAIVVLTSEDWEPHPSPFWVLDATNPANITMLSEWSNPWGHTAEAIHFSLHNPRFIDGILSLASYHGGLLQFDLRTPDTWVDPYLMAYAVSAKGSTASPRDPVEHIIETAYCQLGPTEVGVGNDTPLYMDVETGPGGILYAADLTGGLYTFAPTASHPVFGTA